MKKEPKRANDYDQIKGESPGITKFGIKDFQVTECPCEVQCLHKGTWLEEKCNCCEMAGWTTKYCSCKCHKPKDPELKKCLGCHTLPEDNPLHDCKPKDTQWEKELKNLWFRSHGQTSHFLEVLKSFICQLFQKECCSDCRDWAENP